jgi:uncharacterized protein
MTDSDPDERPRPVPLSPNARRVLGVLVEKAKTTPDNYPMTLAAIVSGCNQKSNRAPQMNLDDDDVLLALDELREVGAAREIQGSGRATKYRHAAYEWLDVDSPAASLMTELLLRGPQTVGELRTRVSRMHPIADLASAQEIIDELIAKDLVEPLSPPGRGQVFAHRLYPPQERQYLNAKLEKQATERQATPSASPATIPETAVERILQRLNDAEEKLEALEDRLKKLESPELPNPSD